MSTRLHRRGTLVWGDSTTYVKCAAMERSEGPGRAFEWVEHDMTVAEIRAGGRARSWLTLSRGRLKPTTGGRVKTGQ